MQRRPFPIAILAVISACALAAETGPEPRIQATVKVEPVQPMTDEERRAVFLAAGRILKHVDQARSSLAETDQEAAKHNIDQALRLVDIVRVALPVYEVSAEISAGELTYEDRQQVQETIVPIFDELERVALLAPVGDAKRSANAETSNSAAVADVELVQTKVELDIEHARKQLTAALAAVEDRDFDSADDMLSEIQTNVRMSRVEINLPLEEARTNLMLARDRFDEGRLEDARFALRVAMDALLDYQSAANEQRKEEITSLYEEMAALEDTLQTDSRFAREKFDAWWDTLSEWNL